jgi:hypothetical protein
MTDRQDELQEVDAATRAFEQMRGEMALVRRAVEMLAAERADIVIPDYSVTLGEIAKRLGATAQGMKVLAGQPALLITPDEMAGRIDAAAAKARQTDHAQLTDSHRRLDEALHDLRAVVRSARNADDQHRRLRLAAAGGALAGALLWSIIPGLASRIAPESWHWPERLAARTLRLDMWSAGERMLAEADPERWQTVILANRILQDNRRAVAGCRQKANKIVQSQRCPITIAPDSLGSQME